MTLRVKDIELSPQSGDQELRQAVLAKLGLSDAEVANLAIRKRSLDARKKSRIVYHYQVDVELRDGPREEERLATLLGSTAAALPAEAPPEPLAGLAPRTIRFARPPVIIGSGPAGTSAALMLARAGQSSIIIERGEPVENRIKTMGRLRRRGEFEPESNYCFGEGGAGTFSDGKLTCGRNHPLIRFLFEQWVNFGAPAEILYEAHPHIGTDYLLRIAKAQRDYLSSGGTEFLFNRRLVDIKPGPRGDGGARHQVILSDGTMLATDHLIVAIGHSARDTYRMLLERGLAMAPKPFAMGARIEHPQAQIDKIQFGSCELLPPAEYKLAAHVGQRGIWTFCMCPGGHLLPTSAQPEHLAINGMSYHARASGFANAAVVVNVLREDFYRGHPLDGAEFQARLERAAFQAGGGGYHSPAQRLVDFVAGRPSRGELRSTYEPGVTAARLDQLLPDFISDALKAATSAYNQKMRGYLSPEALVVGVETKTSAPVVMTRNDGLESVSHPGLFPCGEGAGFAGGIVSAGLDGLRVGRAVLDEALESGRATYAPLC